MITRQEVDGVIANTLNPQAVFGQDFVWDTLTEVGQRAVILWPLRKCIQRLARKHELWESFWNEAMPLIVARCELEEDILRLASEYGGNSSGKFGDEVERLVRGHVRKHKRRHQDAVATPKAEKTLADDYSQRQLQTIIKSVSLVQRMFAGRPPELTPKEFLAIWTGLFSRRSGRQSSQLRKDVFRLCLQALAQGRRPMPGEISHELLGDAPWSERSGTYQKIRDLVKEFRRKARSQGHAIPS